MAYAAAQALSIPVHDDESDTSRSPVSSRRPSTSPISWRRPVAPSSPSLAHDRPRTSLARWLRSARRLRKQGQQIFFSLTPLQRALFIAINVVSLVSLIVFAIFHEPILHWAADKAKAWRHIPGGWMILWALVVFVSFPPVFGYSLCVTISGFVWGMYGWFIVSTGSIIGSTLAFVVSRTLLKGYVSRMTEKNTQFAALALVLKHDGLKLLTMIRLCPLPYSLSNGAISTIPTVKWYNFMLATAIVSPKLLLHVFIGRQIGKLAEQAAQMDMTTRLISYASIVLGIVLGVTVGYMIYVRTRARAIELEAEEVAAAAEEASLVGEVEGRRSRDTRSPGYSDDPAERDVANLFRRDTDVSLHTQFSADSDPERGYRDEFTDDEDAQERNVFEVGDGDLSEHGSSASDPPPRD